jgi:hypothetical protein
MVWSLLRLFPSAAISDWRPEISTRPILKLPSSTRRLSMKREPRGSRPTKAASPRETDSPLEGSGFEPSVPLPRLLSIRAVRADIIGRSTDVLRRDREFDVSALQGRLSTSSQSQCSTDPGPIAGTWHRPLFPDAGPMVRIRFPPPESLRTIGPSAADTMVAAALPCFRAVPFAPGNDRPDCSPSGRQIVSAVAIGRTA